MVGNFWTYMTNILDIIIMRFHCGKIPYLIWIWYDSFSDAKNSLWTKLIIVVSIVFIKIREFIIISSYTHAFYFINFITYIICFVAVCNISVGVVNPVQFSDIRRKELHSANLSHLLMFSRCLWTRAGTVWYRPVSSFLCFQNDFFCFHCVRISWDIIISTVF